MIQDAPHDDEAPRDRTEAIWDGLSGLLLLLLVVVGLFILGASLLGGRDD